MEVLLSVDLSTTCTGWSIFRLDTKQLLEYGNLKQNTKGLSKLTYPTKQLATCLDMAKQIKNVINDASTRGYSIKIILIEEINSGKNRLGQKTLDICHGILWLVLDEELKKVVYIDSDGNQGWRFLLGRDMRMSDADKSFNADAKKLNKKLKGSQKIIVINKKHLACRYVNRTYQLSFDVDKVSGDADIVDSIAMGTVYVDKVLK